MQMIPKLGQSVGLDATYAKYLNALKAEGFSGDIETEFSSRLAVAVDNSVYQLLPQAVIFPKNVDDLSLAARIADRREFESVRFAPRGGGTGTNGQSLNTGVTVDVSRHMNRVLSVNAEAKEAIVQAGVVKDQLNAEIKSTGLFFAPELSTSNRATLGGMISTDASGQGSLVYGKTSQHVKAVKTVLADGSVVDLHRISGAELEKKLAQDNLEGSIYKTVLAIAKGKRDLIEKIFPKLTRFLTGYDLKHVFDPEDGSVDLSRLICGGEGTLGFIVEATLDLTSIPKRRALVNVKYDSFDSALRNAQVMLSSGCLSVETVDSKVLNLAKTDIVWYSVSELLKEVPGKDMQGINIVEFAGDDEDLIRKNVEALAAKLDAQIANSEAGVIGYQYTYDLPSVLAIYAMRKKAVGLLGKAVGDAKPIAFTEDTCVPPEHLADYILEFRALLDSKNLTYGMFGHVDSGVLHVRPALDMCDEIQEEMLHEITRKVVDLTAKYGGLMWGEHGRGFRSQFGPKFFGELYDDLRTVKAAFDSKNKFNPGKIAVPAGLDEELVPLDAKKRGFYDRQINITTRRAYGEVMICNGNGACFNYDVNSPMCPSYKESRDRRNSPKGRATLAREWLRQLSNADFDILAEEANATGIHPVDFVMSYLRKMIPSGYDYNREVMDSLNECLACKACSSQCPVKVDIADFRSKFLCVYHRRYGRPLRDYCVAAIEPMLPVMAHAPKFFNFFMNNPLSAVSMKYLYGLVDLPKLSSPSVYDACRELGLEKFDPEALKSLPDGEKRKHVLLVQDAFTSCYDAAAVKAMLRLMQLAGFVPHVLPMNPNGKVRHVRGFLGLFAKTAASTAEFLNSVSELGLDMIGLDPAMTICYRDEYAKTLGEKRGKFEVLMPHEWLAKILDSIPEKAKAAKNSKKYYLLAHCQEKTFKPATHDMWIKIFKSFGIEIEAVNVGCCGMAGMYGHERIHREKSEKIYNQSFGAAVKKYGVENVLVTGYSCRSQVLRMEGAKAKHPAEALVEEIEKSIKA